MTAGAAAKTQGQLMQGNMIKANENAAYHCMYLSSRAKLPLTSSQSLHFFFIWHHLESKYMLSHDHMDILSCQPMISHEVRLYTLAGLAVTNTALTLL